MALLGVDIGGTKLAFAVLSDEGRILFKETAALENRKGSDAGKLISDKIVSMLAAGKKSGNIVNSVGISVPGINHVATGTVWAPNIEGWEDYPLLAEVQSVCGGIPVTIDSDRACYILGEVMAG